MILFSGNKPAAIGHPRSNYSIRSRLSLLDSQFCAERVGDFISDKNGIPFFRSKDMVALGKQVA